MAEEDNPKIELGISKNENSIDFQRYILDSSSLEESIYLAFCGFRYVISEVKVKGIDGEKIERVKHLERDKKAQILNEAGANYLAKEIFSLTSPMVNTSNLEPKLILRLWKGKLTSTAFSLLDSYYFEDNPYELKVDRLPDIITTLSMAITITSKSKDGFTLKQLTETILTQIRGVVPMNTPQPQQKKGILDKLLPF
jgi:hypothetical protein